MTVDEKPISELGKKPPSTSQDELKEALRRIRDHGRDLGIEWAIKMAALTLEGNDEQGRKCLCCNQTFLSAEGRKVCQQCLDIYKKVGDILMDELSDLLRTT